MRPRTPHDPLLVGKAPPTGAFMLGGYCPIADSKLWTARASCLRLFWHLVRAAASRTFCTAGSKRPIRMAMIAMTTNSSISVNAERRRGIGGFSGG